MKRVATIVTGAALLVPGSALAASGSSTCQSYSPQACVAAGSAGSGNTGPGSTSPVTSTAAGTLPFTGLDVGLLLVGGGTLLGAGFVVRRLSENPSE